MVKMGVCIETLFSEYSFEKRINMVAELGFEGFEFWFVDYWFDGNSFTPREKDVDAISSIMKDNDIALSDFLLNSWDGLIGGSLIRPSDRPLYLKRLRKMASIARELDCQKLITLTGLLEEGIPRRKQYNNIIATLKEASKIAERESIILLLEPLNPLVDHPGYLLESIHEGAQIVEEIGSPSVKLLFDCYHMQITQGNIIASIEKYIDIIEHFHSAGVPGRHEIFMGELNYPNIVKRVDELGYDGYFGLEYFPSMPSEESLKATLSLLT